MNLEELKQILDDADMVLVGIGEDFEQKQFLQTNEEYCTICSKIASSHMEWAMPYVNRKFLKENTRLAQAYKTLETLLAELTDVSCTKCGKPMVLNSLYAEKYDEAGYQPDWALYTKWLQGTLNKKLCILELGSGMMFANVLRFRFEKIAGLNQKSTLVRVHKHLYQLPEEVANRGKGVAKDAVDFVAEIAEVC